MRLTHLSEAERRAYVIADIDPPPFPGLGLAVSLVSLRLKLGLERAGSDAKFFSWPPEWRMTKVMLGIEATRTRTSPTFLSAHCVA